MRYRPVLLLACGFAVCLNACGKDDGKTDPDGSQNPGYCTPEPFTKATESALFDTWNDRLVYSVRSSAAEPYDRIAIYSYLTEPTGLNRAGRYDLVGTDLQDCGTCVVSFKNCQDGDCEKMYYGGSGALIVSEVGGIGERFEGRFDNVLFREIQWDEVDGEYDYVGFGEEHAWCGHEFSFNLTIEEKVPSPTCVEGGSGRLLGDNIANFSLQNCNGDWVDLHDYCGANKAMVLMLISGWCSACHQLVPQIEAERNRLNTDGLETLYIMGEDDVEARPSLAFCKEYALQHDVEPHRMFIDYGDSYPWETFFGKIYPYIDDAFGIPWFAVLDGSNMQYIYNDSVGPGEFDAAISSLMNRP